jgi:hypothetical protein
LIGAFQFLDGMSLYNDNMEGYVDNDISNAYKNSYTNYNVDNGNADNDYAVNGNVALRIHTVIELRRPYACFHFSI